MKKYSNEITIARPVEEVCKYFTDIQYFTNWQPDLLDYNTFEGKPCEAGAKSRVVYREGKNDDVKMVETVLENNLPDNYKVKYSTDGVISHQIHHFEEAEDGSTYYRIDTEQDFEGLVKVLNIFSPDHFKHQTQRFMESFKNFVENTRAEAV